MSGNAIDDAQARELLAAQRRAADLFAEVIGNGRIRAGVSEQELSDQIHALARDRYGVRRHWHRRVVRSGPNTLLTYAEDGPDRRLSDDDLVFLDFGPVFDSWEADFGRSYVLGSDPRKHRLVADLARAFALGRRRYETNPDLSAGELYDYVAGLATEFGLSFGADSAGHLVGAFPHETSPLEPRPFSIYHGNPQRLREPDAAGGSRHWILEIHLVNREAGFGGFLEELLTIPAPATGPR